MLFTKISIHINSDQMQRLWAQFLKGQIEPNQCSFLLHGITLLFLVRGELLGAVHKLCGLKISDF